MGPGRSSSLHIGGDSSAVASSGRTGGASVRSAGVELRDTPGAPPFPLDKGKEKVDLIKYPGGSEYLRNQEDQGSLFSLRVGKKPKKSNQIESEPKNRLIKSSCSVLVFVLHKSLFWFMFRFIKYKNRGFG